MKKGRIPSSALGYAIAFMLLIGFVTSGVLFISSTNKRLEINYALREHMLLNNYLSIQHGARNQEAGGQLLVHSSGDSTMITRKNWGAYRVVVAETFHKRKQLKKSALIGDEIDATHPTLYFPDQRQPLKLCGKTKIEGVAYLPERGLERGYLTGKPYKNDKLLYGTKRKSERTLPSLKAGLRTSGIGDYLMNSVKIDFFQKDSSFSFSEDTRLVSQIEPLYLNNRIEGNIVLHSFDSIIVSTNAQLENVILIAPNVRFEKGFKGTVQVIAHKRIQCDKSVFLKYPSALILNENQRNQSSHKNGIFLREGAKVVGGVLLFSLQPDFRKPIRLELRDAVIGGLVYNQGETELKGKIIGHLYAAKFVLRSGGGNYSNHLLDAIITNKELPKGFIEPNWLKDEKTTKSVILSCF
ncbi:MAG: hypothetical protein MK066_09075 [Crocinitomicaceae bacterium]|nr:hypothetical protein [Crocinitomicaceae bacterium]